MEVGDGQLVVWAPFASDFTTTESTASFLALSGGSLSFALSLTARLTGERSDSGLHGCLSRLAVPERLSQCNTLKQLLHTANGRKTWSMRTR